MKNLVLDTDIFIDYLRGFEKSKEYFKKIRSENYFIYFSAITEAELISGNECKKIEKKQEIIDLLSNFTKVPVNNKLAVKSGDFSRVYEVKLPDSLIAATAYLLKAKLITRNIKHYKKIKELKISNPY